VFLSTITNHDEHIRKVVSKFLHDVEAKSVDLAKTESLIVREEMRTNFMRNLMQLAKNFLVRLSGLFHG
jgi:hypothetical protein